jgi:hypothetical protein
VQTSLLQQPDDHRLRFAAAIVVILRLNGAIFHIPIAYRLSVGSYAKVKAAVEEQVGHNVWCAKDKTNQSGLPRSSPPDRPYHFEKKTQQALRVPRPTATRT